MNTHVRNPVDRMFNSPVLTAGKTTRTVSALILFDFAIPVTALAIALQTLCVNPGPLFVTTAFFAFAVGFAMQNLAQNLVSGIILIAERIIKAGNVLLVDFGDSAVNYEISVWAHDTWVADVDISSLSEAIQAGLKLATISVPFPQRGVHVSQPPQSAAKSDPFGLRWSPAT